MPTHAGLIWRCPVPSAAAPNASLRYTSHPSIEMCAAVTSAGAARQLMAAAKAGAKVHLQKMCTEQR